MFCLDSVNVVVVKVECMVKELGLFDSFVKGLVVVLDVFFLFVDGLLEVVVVGVSCVI